MSDEEKPGKPRVETELLKTESNPQNRNLSNALQKLSEEEPKAIKEMMAFMASGPIGNPLHQKMESGHITQVLDLAIKHDERQFELTKQSNSSETGHLAH